MIKLLSSTLTTVIACAMLSIASPVLAQTSDEDCAGTMGAGFGLCTAASHLGCGTESEKNGNACTKIEDNFVKITGEMPPWLAPPVALCSDFLYPNEDIFQCDSSVACPTDCSVRAYFPGGTQRETCACFTK